MFSIHSAVAPSRASAFIGQGLVEAAGGGLTAAAEKVVKAGKFIPEQVIKAGAQGGATEAGEVAGTFESAGVVPLLGSVVSFGVGTKIGSEICHAIGIEGCWYYGSEGADPSPEVSGSWNFLEKPPQKNAYGYAYYFYQEGYGGAWKPGGLASGSPCGQKAPGGGTFISSGEKAECTKTDVGTFGVEYRSALANREFTYHASDEAGISNYSGSKFCAVGGGCTSEPPSNWAKNLVTQIQSGASNEAEQQVREKVGQSIAHEIDPEHVADPFASTGTVPNCGGLTFAQCEALLEGQGLEAVKNTLGWQTADLSQPASRVTQTAPAAGQVVGVKTKVTVTVNPAELPLVVPEVEEGETYSHYAARLAPGLNPQRHDVEAPYADGQLGPNAVLGTDPQPDTRLDPSTEHDVDVDTNPADVPVPAGGWSPPAVASIDTTPLNGIGACTSFPFGIFCWISEGLEQFDTSGQCPEFTGHVPSIGGGAPADFSSGLCASGTEKILTYVRAAILLIFVTGCAWMFVKATRAVGGD